MNHPNFDLSTLVLGQVKIRVTHDGCALSADRRYITLSADRGIGVTSLFQSVLGQHLRGYTLPVIGAITHITEVVEAHFSGIKTGHD